MTAKTWLTKKVLKAIADSWAALDAVKLAIEDGADLAHVLELADRAEREFARLEPADPLRRRSFQRRLKRAMRPALVEV